MSDPSPIATASDLGSQIRRQVLRAERRGAKKIKRSVLARHVGISPSSLYAYLSGTTLPPADVLDSILRELGVEATELRRLATARDALESRSLRASAPTFDALPPDVPDFVGRVDQLAVLDRERRSTGAVVAISGTAGVGKTALALHWAHRVRGRFPDGCLHLDLRGFDPGHPVAPEAALETLLLRLGILGTDIPADLADRTARFRSLVAGRRMLLLLDNARDAEQVRPLLPGAPSSIVLITSRDRLAGLVARDGARRIDVDLLPPEDASALLRNLIDERADAEPEATDRLARLCARLPLALRVAAESAVARDGVSLSELADELAGESRRLDLLDAGGDPRADVRRVFSWSYRQLPAEVARAFRLLGIVPGRTVTVSAVAALTGHVPARARAVLQNLTTAHLVQRQGPDRFDCHDLLRDYARDLVEATDPPTERAAALSRLFGWYLSRANACADAFYPETVRLPAKARGPLPEPAFTEDAPPANWVAAELDTLVAAAQHAAEHGPAPAAWLLADALHGYFRLGGHPTDWAIVSAAGLVAAQRSGDRLGEAAARLSLGDACQMAGQLTQAHEHLGGTPRLARDVGWGTGEAAALNGLAAIDWQHGRLAEAVEQYQQALRILDTGGGGPAAATCLLNLAGVHNDLGLIPEMARYATQALERYRASGSSVGASWALSVLGEADIILGRPASAVERLTEAMAVQHEMGHKASEADTMLILANAYTALDRIADAEQLAVRAQELADDVGDPRTRAIAFKALGAIESRRGDHRAAAGRYQAAFDLADKHGYLHHAVDAMVGLARATLPTDARRANWWARRAVEAAAAVGLRLHEARARAVLAEVELATGASEEAVAQAQHAVNRPL